MARNYFLFLLLALLWSFSFISIKISIETWPPLFSALMRVLIAFITLSIIFSFKNRHQAVFIIPIRQALLLWLTGLFTQALPFAFLFYGEKFINPALASILNSTVSIWALIIGTLFFRDFSQWTILKLCGLLLGLSGVTIIFWPMLYMPQAHHSLTGVLSVCIMAICYAIGGLLTQHLIFKKTTTLFESNLWHQSLSSLTFLLMLTLAYSPLPSLHSFGSFKLITAVLYMGIFATACAWIIYFYLIKHWGTVCAASAMYLVPILAIIWDYLFLHLIPAWNEGAGIIIILSGVTLIQYKPKTKPINLT